MLDNRLKMCAEMVTGRGTVVDVGTDHALLAAELITSGKCSHVIASDINEGPLESARKTVEKYGIADKVELVLSDGLENVSLDYVTDIVIAGMGGETIIDILDKKKDMFYGIRLILQPMTKPELLRKWLTRSDLIITTERAVAVGDRIYTVMCAKRGNGVRHMLTEFESIYGFFDGDVMLKHRYYAKEIGRLQKKRKALEAAGKFAEGLHCQSLSNKIEIGSAEFEVQRIYEVLNEEFPVALQEKWDNSGLLVESQSMKCSKVLLTLDINEQTVNEAVAKKVGLIVSHHPVIFDPLKKISRDDPVFKLIRNDIAAICMHTNLDIAEGGTNGVILEQLTRKLAFDCEAEPFEDLGGGRSLGYILTLNNKMNDNDFGRMLKSIFGCSYVRKSNKSEKWLSKIAICSGSGGSMLGLALEKGCDALVTGDVKHDVWIESLNRPITVFDCGHFHTENLVLTELRRFIEEYFQFLDVEIAEYSVDPCTYI